MGLRAFLLRLLVRLRRPRRPAPETPAIDLAFEASPSAVRNVRQIYRGLLAKMTQRGLPRPLDQTAYDYLKTLERRLPLGSPDLGPITEAYVQARYSDRPLPDA